MLPTGTLGSVPVGRIAWHRTGYQLSGWLRPYCLNAVQSRNEIGLPTGIMERIPVGPNSWKLRAKPAEEPNDCPDQQPTESEIDQIEQ